jgi:hypothetical protein
MPLLCIYLVSHNKETFNNENFKKLWGSFYEGINTKNKANTFYNFLFIFRRLIFFFIAFALYKYPIV